jgi:hypothetical protein
MRNRISANEKLEIGLCLVHPAYRITVSQPNIIKVEPSDLLKEPTLAVVARLGQLSPNIKKMPHITSRKD